MKLKTALYFFIAINCLPAYSQNVDSLKNLLNNASGDKQISLLLQIGEYYLSQNTDEAMKHAEKALKISQNLNSKKLIALSTQLKGKVYFVKRNYVEARENLVEALGLFKTIKDSGRIASLYDNLGDLYEKTGQTDSALIFFDKVADISSRTGDKKLEALAYSSSGLIYWRKGRNRNALENHFKALELRKELKLPHSVAMSANNIGVVYWRLGNYQKALEYYTESLNLRESLHDMKGMNSTNNNIGMIYLKLNDYGKAESIFFKALEDAKNFDFKFGIAYSNHCLSILHYEKENYHQSIYHSEAAINKYYELGELNSVALSMNYLGKSYAALKEFSRAINIFNAALDTAIKINDKFSLTHLLLSTAEVYLAENYLAKATEYVERSLALATEENFVELLVDNNLLFSKIMKKRGSYLSALEYYEKYVSLKETLRLEQLSADISEWQIRNATQEKEFENEILRKDNKLKAAQVEKEKVYRNWLIIFSIIAILLLIGLYRYYQYKKRTAQKILEQKEELERLNSMLSEKNIGLEEHNRIKDKLFSVIAHDLKTPFQSLLGFSEIIIDEIDTLTKEELIEYSRAINKSSKSLLSMTQNLLNWSRMQFNKFSISNDEIDVNDIVEKVVDFQSDIAAGKNLNFKIHVEKNLIIKSDEDMLQTILRNLTSNAIKFSHPGGNILIKSDLQNGHLKLSIEDEGVGIPEERLKNIFSPEFMESTSGTQSEKGTGLGLMITKEFVENLGGTITAESKPGKGSRFTIVLPRE